MQVLLELSAEGDEDVMRSLLGRCPPAGDLHQSHGWDRLAARALALNSSCWDKHSAADGLHLALHTE